MRKKKIFPLTIALVWAIGSGPFAAATGPRFSAVMERAPEKIWAPGVDPRVSDSVHAFIQKKKLADGLVYGASMRELDLSKRCRQEIEAFAKKRGCRLKNDLVRNPPGSKRANLPVRDLRGRTIPLLSYLCPDGGVIRMKPRGDSTNPKEHEPSVVKAMRFFGSPDYENFSDEAFKVDNDGRPIPKWAKDLNLDIPGLGTEQDRKIYIEQWARDAHSRLRPCP